MEMIECSGEMEQGQEGEMMAQGNEDGSGGRGEECSEAMKV